jgi:hypothetical protein
LLVCLGILVIVAQWILHNPFHIKPALFVLLCMLLVPLASALTGVGADAHHVILAYPFPHLVIATGIAWLAGVGQKRLATALPAKILALSVTAFAVSISVTRIQAGLNTLERTGGTANWSDAIYRLAGYFSAKAPLEAAVALDWGIHYPLVGLTQGRVTSLELWPELNNPAASDSILGQGFANPQNRYVLHAADITNFPLPREKFFQVAAALGCTVGHEASFTSRSGETIFEIYKVSACVDSGAALGPPQDGQARHGSHRD